MIGVMFAGKDDHGRDDMIYLALNTYWEDVEVTLPKLIRGVWRPAVDTARDTEAILKKEELLSESRYIMRPRSVCIFMAVQSQKRRPGD